jgi:hypothetical protein
MESPLDKQMAEIKTKADLIKWVTSLPEDLDGIILVSNPQTRRLTVAHLGGITLPRSLWSMELYKKWLLEQ